MTFPLSTAVRRSNSSPCFACGLVDEIYGVGTSLLGVRFSAQGQDVDRSNQSGSIHLIDQLPIPSALEIRPRGCTIVDRGAACQNSSGCRANLREIAERSSRSSRLDPTPAVRHHFYEQYSFAISRRGARSYADGLILLCAWIIFARQPNSSARYWFFHSDGSGSGE